MTVGYIGRKRQLEDAVDDVGADCGACSEDSCRKLATIKDGSGKGKKGRTSVPHLLSKLLPMLVEFALPSTTPARLAHFHRHIAIPTARTPRYRRHRCCHQCSVLLIQDLDIAPWENALGARPLVAAFGPVGVHELGDGDSVVGQESQVPGIGGGVFIECGGGGEGLGRLVRVCGWGLDGCCGGCGLGGEEVG